MGFLTRQKQVVLLTGLCGLVLAAGVSYWWYGPGTPRGDPELFRPVRYIRREERPTTRVPRQKIQKVPDALNPEDLVLGVTVGGEACAYPIKHMNAFAKYKILNDTLGGRPIAATW